MTSSTDSREGSPFCVDSPFDEDYTSEDISMNEFIRTHRDNILKLINTNNDHQEQDYKCEQYNETPTVYLDEDNSDVDTNKSNLNKPSPLDTSYETLDDISPTKTPFAPVTKERRSIEEDDEFIPTSPLPLVGN